MYVDNSEWQEKVKELIAEAGLIYTQIGESEGLLWELNQVVETVDPQQVIMGLPFVGQGGEQARQAQYDRFRMKCVSALPKSLPEEIGHAQFLYFGEGWSPQLFIPHKSVQLPQPFLTEQAELPLQFQALKRLQAEFMLVSTPYWVRFCGLMLGIMILWIFIVFIGLRLLVHP